LFKEAENSLAKAESDLEVSRNSIMDMNTANGEEVIL
jgi:hypothetical protein